MLKSLLIQNYALIDDVSIQFNEGFTAITGETGAGKSMLLGALSLLLGNRADYGVIREKSKKCIVEGQFDLSKIQIADFFVQYDLDFEFVTLIRREIIPSGRSRAFINDTPVNLDLLKELGILLVDIHSQHESLEIGKSVFQREVLDYFVNEPELIIQYRKEYDKLIELSNALKKLTEENEQLKRDENYYRFQYEELKTAELVEGEDQLLANREKLLIHAEEVMQGMQSAQQLLSDGEDPILEKLNELYNWFSKIEKYHPDFSEILQRIKSTRIELEDISTEINKMDVLTDFDPDELSRISERLSEIYKLQQKHHVSSVSALLELQTDYEEKLNNLDHDEEYLKQLKMNIERVSIESEKLAVQIHNARKREAPNLALSVKNVLVKLGMKDAGFEVTVNKLEQLSQDGIDKVNFLFTANTGGQLKEISAIASGGELSRLMLAIKSQITKEKLLPTVVFDEIDSGVSGEIAGKVGNIINEMSKHHQIIAITHLPQIAAKADEHFKVYKLVVNEKTITNIELLNEQTRVEEIAKLLSDEKVSGAALETARELLNFNLQ